MKELTAGLELNGRPARKRSSFVSLISLTSLLFSSLACNALFPPRPVVDWDTRPEALIVEANTGGGMVYEPNAIPDGRLWGDGRLVWVEYDGSGARQVLTVQLTPDQQRATLAGFVEAGFFGWDDYYSPGVVYDAPSTCLRVALVSLTKSVCETLSGAPRAFGPLYGDLASGAGQAGAATPLAPTQGFLTAFAIGPALPEGSTAVAWPADLGLPLDSLSQSAGQWLEPAPLALAWEAINAEPFYTLLRDGEIYYQAQLKVPGVTNLEPPEKP